MRRFALAFLAVVVLAACGAVPPGTEASSSQSASPVQESPTPFAIPNAFLPGDCTYPATAGTPTQPAHDTFRTAISVPQGWGQNDTSGFDATIFQLVAPSTYQYSPTTINIVSLFADVPHHSSAQYLAGLTQGYYTIVGQIETCTVKGDSAAYVQYTKGTGAGYMVLWLHLAVAYQLILEGNGGIDPRAIQDAKGVLASLSWTSNTPPPQYTPSPAS
jgi:hypothetical protein